MGSVTALVDVGGLEVSVTGRFGDCDDDDDDLEDRESGEDVPGGGVGSVAALVDVGGLEVSVTERFGDDDDDDDGDVPGEGVGDCER